MTRLQRLLRNVFGEWFAVRRCFSAGLLDEMTQAVAMGERQHKGEVCIAIESRLAPLAVLEGLDAPMRAAQAFGQLRVWNTEHNNGVLLYILMAEHRIEIVADRGIARHVAQDEWDAICTQMRERFVTGAWREGCLEGIAAVHVLLTRHFPGNDKAEPDELSDRPVLL
ncbi:TPM domain-containing protein [Dyella silvatica]|uniref:TPM domain-containing protein n=1 Tax=Dyella silvatica TaxID=2992128 RepID=UPI0022520794|nr:TPM domain-containing protein [Dyella silvatica]